MMKILLFIPLMFALAGCTSSVSRSSNNNDIEPSRTSEEAFATWLDENIKIKESDEEDMKLSIDHQNVDVTWEDNNSIKALTELAKNTLTIHMHEYGGFEQTGSIGSSIVRNDSQINTEPGDIVLFNGNAISVFYEPSRWSYTRLGHINMNKNELNTLLNKDAVTFVLEVK